MKNFSEEMLDQDNTQVDELCACPGKQLTRSRRVLKENHEDWCWYFMHVTDKQKAAGLPPE